MNSTQFIPPVTLEEFRFKFKLTLGKMKKDTKIEYSVVQLHNQFKVVGLITKSPFIRWFKFTLKPPYSIAHDKLRLAIWDTSF